MISRRKITAVLDDVALRFRPDNIGLVKLGSLKSKKIVLRYAHHGGTVGVEKLASAICSPAGGRWRGFLSSNLQSGCEPEIAAHLLPCHRGSKN
jgi:hypothetical protein